MPNGPQETNCSIRPQSYKSFKHICPGTFSDLVSKCLMSRLNPRICWSRQVRVQPWVESACCVFLAKTMSLFTHESNWQYPRELFGKQTKCWWEGGTTCDGLASQGRGVGLLQVSSMLQKLVFIKSLEFK